MQITDIRWRRDGDGRSATVLGAGDLTYDLHQADPKYPLVQVCEFPCIDADGEPRTLTYWKSGEDAIARFLSDKHNEAVSAAEAA